MKDSLGYIRVKEDREHRLVFEEYYKCRLLKWGVVHHKNGKRDDNRITNLEGMTRNRHTELHKRKPEIVNRLCCFCNNKSERGWFRVGDKYQCVKCYYKRKYLEKTKNNIKKRRTHLTEEHKKRIKKSITKLWKQRHAIK